MALHLVEGVKMADDGRKNVQSNINETKYENPGFQNVRTTNVFRVLNFELFVKPNKYVMALGLAAITGCCGYLVYLNVKSDGKDVYRAVNEDGSLSLRVKTSRWD